MTRVFCCAGEMAGMRYSLVALFWLTTCFCLLASSFSLPTYFTANYRLVNIATGKVFEPWVLEAMVRLALTAIPFFVGLRLIRNRFYRQS
jgi:hypothetical protein